MGGHQVESHGTGDDGFDEDGYDESQRAEILEATRNGPSDGTVIVDLNPDIGMKDDDQEEEDDLRMDNDEVGEEVRADHSSVDNDEDDIQDEFDDGSDGEDELDDSDDEALKP